MIVAETTILVISVTYSTLWSYSFLEVFADRPENSTTVRRRSDFAMRMTEQKKLVEFLVREVRSLDSPPFVFTDGLDECSQRSWTRLSEYLKNLSREAAETRPTYNKERDGIIVVRTVEDRSLNLLQEVNRLGVVSISAEAKGDALWTKMTSIWQCWAFMTVALSPKEHSS
jgi:hypothetical protein